MKMFTLIIRWLVSEGCERNRLPYPNKRFTVSLKPIIFSVNIFTLLSITGCANIPVYKSEGFIPNPSMSEDAQDFYNSKYNLMDSNDGSNDPTASATIFNKKF